MHTQEKIRLLRQLMEKNDVQAYWIPSSDPHLDEYVPDFWQRRRFISDFTGSAGDVVVTQESCGLWTDSRYFLQAENQLDSRIFTLFKSGMPGVPSIKNWLKQELEPGQFLGVDPRVITHLQYKEIKAFLEGGGAGITCLFQNLVDKIWLDRPEPPDGRIGILEDVFTGERIDSKLGRLRTRMREEGAAAHIITKLDAIAWLFNIRGTDVEYNPVVIAYAIVTMDKASLFVDLKKVPQELKSKLKNRVEIREYAEFESEVNILSRENRNVWLDGTSVNQWIFSIFGTDGPIINKMSPVDLFKAVKNAVEIEGMKKAHIRDGRAMVEFLSWLDRSLGTEVITEISAAEKLRRFREENEHFQGLSFETISSYADHGAIVHYAPSQKTDVSLEPGSLYIIDSGGQYLDGTTDITRTIALGSPTEEQKDRFTRVLKGVIALSSTSFPKGTVGKQLDTIARLALWKQGLNFLHGTGHGIGHFLNVHEGPQALSYYRCIGIAFEPGMIQSVEPAFYKDGDYGLRVENVTLVVKDEKLSSPEGEFYTFETLTLCPIDRSLINRNMLLPEEIDWLNSYHRTVRDTLTPLLDEQDAGWLSNACRPL